VVVYDFLISVLGESLTCPGWLFDDPRLDQSIAEPLQSVNHLAFSPQPLGSLRSLGWPWVVWGFIVWFIVVSMVNLVKLPHLMSHTFVHRLFSTTRHVQSMAISGTD
jgi:hypothetical protein